MTFQPTPLVLLLSTVALTAGAHAADQPGAATTERPRTAIPPESTDSSPFSLSLGVDFTDKYYFRGLLQEDHGLIAQPSLELGLLLHETEDWSLSAYAGLWGSYHDEKTGADDPDDSDAGWYEVDLYAGLSLATGRLTTDLTYTHYASPNDAFQYTDEVSLTLAWDDSGWIEAVTLSPYALIGFEVDGGQADGGDDRGVFLALGIEPSHTFESTPVGDLTLSLPVEAGFSLDDYYEGDDDETFGYLTVGLAASVALPAPANFGDWSLSVGVNYLLLGDTAEAANDGDDSEWIVHAGIAIDF